MMQTLFFRFNVGVLSILAVLGLAFFSGAVQAQSGSALREKTRTAFEKEDYAKALKFYQELAQSDRELALRSAREFQRMLFEKAIEHARNRQYEKYREAMNTLRRMDPTPDEIGELFSVVGQGEIASLPLDASLRTRDLDWLMRVFESFRRSRLVDGKRMSALIARLVNPDISITERELIYKEIEILGQYTIPYLIKYIADDNQKGRQTLAIRAMERIGARAVLPACELLMHADDSMKIHAVNILGSIRPVDTRAVAMLKWLIDDPKTSPTVVTSAKEAFFNITNLDPTEGRTAAEYFFILSNRYYMDQPTVADEALAEDGLVWHLTTLPENPTKQDIRNQTLEYMKVKPYAWNEIQAERFARRGIKSVPEGSRQDELFYPLLACIYAAQYQEVKYLLDIVAEDPKGRPLTDEDLLEIKSRYVNYSSRCKFIARAFGPKYVYQGIGKSLRDNRPEVASFLLELIPPLDPTGKMLPLKYNPKTQDKGKKKDKKKKKKPAKRLPPSADTIITGNMPIPLKDEGRTMIDALTNPNQRVRFAAAIALAKMNPPRKFEGYENVATILGDAISVASKPVILLVEEDASERNRVRAALESLGYGVTEAVDGEQGVAAALQYPPKDLILLSDKLQANMSTRKVIDALQENSRTRAIPFAILGKLENMEALKAKFGADVTYIPREFQDLGTRKGALTGSTDNTLVDTRATFTTTGAGLSGATVRIITGNGRGQVRKILSNTDTTLTLEEKWHTNPNPGSTYEIEAGDNQRLMYPIESLITNKELPSVTRLYANQVAVAAAIALAEMDPERTVIRKEDLNAPISRVLSSQISNDLRLQLIKAAKNLKIESAVGTLREIALNAQYTSDIRSAAVEAIAHIGPGTYPDLPFSLITESSEDIRRAVAIYLGLLQVEQNDNSTQKKMLDKTESKFIPSQPPVLKD